MADQFSKRQNHNTRDIFNLPKSSFKEQGEVDQEIRCESIRKPGKAVCAEIAEFSAEGQLGGQIFYSKKF